MSNTAATIDVESPAFAVRLGKLLTAARRERGRSIRSMAAGADGLFSAAQLRRLESGSLRLDQPMIDAICQLYGADLGGILPSRVPVSIDGHVITAGGVWVRFSTADPTSLLTAYLQLIRSMRHRRKAPAIDLRRDDIEALAGYLNMTGEDVVDRLTSLMGATAAQRTAIASLFATGAIVIGLAAVGTVSIGPVSVAQATEVASLTTGSVETDDVDAPLEPEVAVVEVVDTLEPDVAVVEVVDTLEPDVAVVEVVDIGTPAGYADPIDQAIPTSGSTDAVADPDTADPSAVAAETSTTDAPDVDATDDTAWSVDIQANADAALASPTLAPPTDTAATGIGAITMPADSAGLVPAARVQMPQPAVSPDSPNPPPMVNQSGCESDVASPAMSIVIPDISYDCPVYAGGQALIDAGFVTLVTDVGSSSALATQPGDPGTLWLAAHRTTHGGPFADVPNLADGAIITVADGADIASYRVVGRAYIEVRDGRVVDGAGQATTQATWESIVRQDEGGNLAPRLVLQTCEGENFRWMIYADLVTA